MRCGAPHMEEQPGGTDPHFYLRVPEGKVFGPVPAQQLNRWVMEGRLDAECEIRTVEGSIWQKARYRYPILALPEGVASGSPFLGENARSSPGGYYLAHRGGWNLLLAVIGLVGFCPIFSLAAWAMAYTDLEHMATERMDPAGRPYALWAYYLGMLTTIGYGLIFMALLMISLVQILI